MKTSTLVAWISYALFFLFMYASISKLIAFDFYVYDLKRSPLLKPYTHAAAIAVPAFELVVAVLLIIEKTRSYGLTGAAFLMLLFTGYVAYVLFFTSERPCTCGGIIRELTWPQHLIFNLGFLLLVITGVYLKHITYPQKQVL